MTTPDPVGRPSDSPSTSQQPSVSESPTSSMEPSESFQPTVCECPDDKFGCDLDGPLTLKTGKAGTFICPGYVSNITVGDIFGVCSTQPQSEELILLNDCKTVAECEEETSSVDFCNSVVQGSCCGMLGDSNCTVPEGCECHHIRAGIRGSNGDGTCNFPEDLQVLGEGTGSALSNYACYRNCPEVPIMTDTLPFKVEKTGDGGLCTKFAEGIRTEDAEVIGGDDAVICDPDQATPQCLSFLNMMS